MGVGKDVGQVAMELVMSSKFMQWMLWALVMMVFTGLTLDEPMDGPGPGD